VKVITKKPRNNSENYEFPLLNIPIFNGGFVYCRSGRGVNHRDCGGSKREKRQSGIWQRTALERIAKESLAIKRGEETLVFLKEGTA
jgi:hypothetical protein